MKKDAKFGQSSILKSVNSKWEKIYKLYKDIRPAPPLDYLDSLELALVLKDQVDDEDVCAIFAHGKPLEFWGCPRLLVPKIVEAFTGLLTEPTCLDVTITALLGVGAMVPSEAWPQIYATHLPCYACTTAETVDKRRRQRCSSHAIPSSVAPAKAFVVEKFHVSSKSFGKRLTLEVHYHLQPAAAGTKREQYSEFHRITVRLDDEVCSTREGLSGTASRSSATLLLLPEFASDVFGFLDRAHIGSSLLANRGLHNRIYQLKQRLPVHLLKCAFASIGWNSGTYWLTVRHFQRDLTYISVRRFKIPSTAGPESDCALLRHYLSNSHVDDLHAPQGDFRFAIKMLASLAARNFSVGTVELYTEAQRLSDYRSMDAVFGGMRMRELDLCCAEHRFVELVKTTDFFRMSTVQGLRVLKLNLTYPSYKGRAASKSPLWVSGIYLLPNCQHYRIINWTHRHLQSIERKIVQICEEFERGNITDIVQHFEFRPRSPKRMNYAFSRNNLLVSGKRIKRLAWDVYRFRNASTGDYLTACVGRSTSFNDTESILHLVKGEVYPDASFESY